MKELYYEQVEQNVAYDLTNLWSKCWNSIIYRSLSNFKHHMWSVHKASLSFENV